MTERREENIPTTVPQEAKRVGDIRDRWFWVEPNVWTERMLTALETGVKGGRWYSLMDKVYSKDNLRSAFIKVAANKGSPGIDHQTVKMFETNLETNLDRLSQWLQEGRYRPQAIKRVWIPKPGSKEKRPLGIPTVRDRVVQAAVRHVLEPVFEKDFADHSYGFRPGRGCKDALRQVDLLLKQGYTYVVDADLKSYFDTIPHDKLMDRMRNRIADNRILELVEMYLKQQIMETTSSWTPETGTPQGAVLSPLLSNIYLNPLDHLMAQSGFKMVRYADDFVILCRSQAEALIALGLVQIWTGDAGLVLHPAKTRIVDTLAKGGFDFLGYHFERGMRWSRRKSDKKLKDSIRAKTKRTNGHSLRAIITEINPILKGWFEYFKHGRRSTFDRIDSWVRMRLRSILRKRNGGKGRGRGLDHLRWKNAFFAELGLFSLLTAHRSACKSSMR